MVNILTQYFFHNKDKTQNGDLHLRMKDIIYLIIKDIIYTILSLKLITNSDGDDVIISSYNE